MRHTIQLTMLLAAMAFTASPLHAETLHEQTKAGSTETAHTSDVYTFKIGNYAALALRDGDLQFPNDTKVFGIGQTPTEVAELLRAAGQPTDHLSVKGGEKVYRQGGVILYQCS